MDPCGLGQENSQKGCKEHNGPQSQWREDLYEKDHGTRQIGSVTLEGAPLILTSSYNSNRRPDSETR
jgi:hypothetical protein